MSSNAQNGDKCSGLEKQEQNDNADSSVEHGQQSPRDKVSANNERVGVESVDEEEVRRTVLSEVGVEDSDIPTDDSAMNSSDISELLQRRKKRIAQQVEERIRAADERRSEMEREREQRLEEKARQRAAKASKLRELRHKALQQFIVEAPQHFTAFSDVGLFDEDLTTEATELILMSDPRICDGGHCSATQSPLPVICPITQRPHRRSLVAHAEKLLRLLADARYTLMPAQMNLSSGPRQRTAQNSGSPVGGNGESSGPLKAARPARRPRRVISINPQLFVLAFYNSTFKNPSDSPAGAEDARAVVKTLRQLRDTLLSARTRGDGRSVSEQSENGSDNQASAGESVVSEGVVGALLGTLADSWRCYVQVSDAQVAGNKEEVESARRVLLTDAQTALKAAYERLTELIAQATPVSDAIAGEVQVISSYISLLRERMRRLGGDEALIAFDTEMENREQHTQQQEQTSTQAPPTEAPPQRRTSEAESGITGAQSNNQVLTDFYTATSASETEPQVSIEFLQQRRGSGDSEETPASRERSRRDQIEYRARAAFSASLGGTKPATTQEEDEHQRITQLLREQLDATVWEQFRTELDRGDTSRVPVLLGNVSKTLLDAVPRRIVPRIEHEIRDVLDWAPLRSHIRNPQLLRPHISTLLAYMTNLIGQLGAPVRETELQSRAMTLTEQLQALCEGQSVRKEESSEFYTLSEIIVEIFKFIFASIRQLREDISAFSLQMVSRELAEKSVQYEREFIDIAFPPDPKEWTSTVSFLRLGHNTSEHELVLPALEGSARVSLATALPALPVLFPRGEDTMRKLFCALLAGVHDLLRSGGRVGATRWSTYPREALYLERGIAFQLSDTVQLATLRLMLTGTAGMILQPIKIRPASVQDYLATLDKQLVMWLGRGSGAESDETVRAGTMTELKSRILESLNNFFDSDPPRASVAQTHSERAEPLPPLSLNEDNRQVLEGVIDKMVDTTSRQYILFESRFLTSLLAVALKEITASASGSRGTQVAQQQEAMCTIALRSVGALISSAATEVGQKLAKLILHNWEVHKPYYEKMTALVLVNQE